LQISLLFRDTIRIPINTISKVTYQRKPYRFHRAFMGICYWGTVVCIAGTLIEFSYIPDKIDPSHSFVHGTLSLIALGGAIAIPILYHHVNARVLPLRKWKIRTNLY